MEPVCVHTCAHVCGSLGYMPKALAHFVTALCRTCCSPALTLKDSLPVTVHTGPRQPPLPEGPSPPPLLAAGAGGRGW